MSIRIRHVLRRQPHRLLPVQRIRPACSPPRLAAASGPSENARGSSIVSPLASPSSHVEAAPVVLAAASDRSHFSPQDSVSMTCESARQRDLSRAVGRDGRSTRSPCHRATDATPPPESRRSTEGDGRSPSGSSDSAHAFAQKTHGVHRVRRGDVGAEPLRQAWIVEEGPPANDDERLGVA